MTVHRLALGVLLLAVTATAGCSRDALATSPAVVAAVEAEAVEAAPEIVVLAPLPSSEVALAAADGDEPFPLTIEPATPIEAEGTAAIVGGRPLPEPWAAAPAARGALAPPKISATSAVVLDEASLAVLYEKDAHRQRAPASLTKIATAILAAESGDLDARVVSNVDGTNMGRSTVMGIKPGDEFSLRDMLYGLMLPSGNDAALAIARHLAGHEREFAQEMTALALRLGLSDTRFSNPHGLGSRNHYSSAYDLAVLSRYLMTFPELQQVSAAQTYTAKGSRTISMRTYNSFLRTYTGADGGKTGYTRSAGPSIMVSATRGGHRVYVVVLNSTTRDADAKALLDWAFAAHTWP